MAIDFDHTIAAARIAPYTDKTPEEIFSLFFDSGIIARFEAGLILPDAFFQEVTRILNLKLGYRDFLPIWNEIFFMSEKNYRVLALARQLRKNYFLALLTNINVLHFEYLKTNFSVFEPFHRVFASCEMGLTKPDPRIYEKVLEVLCVEAKAAFYTDDRPELVTGARSLGIHGFVFIGASQLEQDLTSVGVVVGPEFVHRNPK